MKNIAIAKIGKSIKFRESKYAPTGGDNEISGLIKALANNNPSDKFYLVGKSDFQTLSDNEKHVLFPYNNVIDIWVGHKAKITSEDLKKEHPSDDHIGQWFKKNNVKIDFAVMMMGQIGNVTIPGKIKTLKDPNIIATVIEMTRGYTTPIIKWLNEYNVKYIEIINDPRYTKSQTRDFIADPTCSLSQYDYSYIHKSIKSYDDQTFFERTNKVQYSGMETLFCVGRNEPTLQKKTNEFTVVLNEGDPSRYNLLNEWVLQQFPTVNVYGEWHHEKTKNDTRFVGTRKLNEIQKIMADTKYTFIIPIRKGWVTSKYIECIHAGVIPFLHPTYDEQNHLNMPSLCRPTTPQKLLKLIDAFNKDDAFRESFVEDLQNLFCKKEYYDGTFISKQIMSVYDNKYQLSNLQKFVKAEVATLEEFFG